MKTYIFLLVLAAFLQSSFLAINLVLILLICRSLIVSDKNNLFLAFGFGILVGILQSQNIGFWALIYLVVVRAASLSRRLPVSKNLITVLVVASLFLVLVSLAESLFFKQTLNLQKVLIEAILTLLVYLILLFWEERFVVKGDIRLKLGGQ